MRDSVNNLSFPSNHFLTSKHVIQEKNLHLRKSFLLTVSLLKLQTKKLKNMLMKEVKVLHSRNSLNYLGPWNLSVNSFQTKCSILTDNAFQTKR